jgi:hypothetical protein
VVDAVSALDVLDSDEVDGGGGGSMTEGAGDGFERGSGRAGMGSSEEDVSMVIFRVTGGDWRNV